MHADSVQVPYNRPDETFRGNYRKRDDGDHEVPSTTNDHCRWIRRRGGCGTGDRLRRDAHSRGDPARAVSRREEHDLYTSMCVPHLVPNAGSPYSAIPGNPDLAAVNLPGGGGAIPCTGHNSGQCIGLSELQQPPMVTPESSVGSSPTVTGSTGSIG